MSAEQNPNTLQEEACGGVVTSERGVGGYNTSDSTTVYATHTDGKDVKQIMNSGAKKYLAASNSAKCLTLNN